MAGFNMDDYVPVNERIEAFYKKHPDGSLQSEIVEHTETRVTVKAYAYRDREDTRPGTGLSSETIPGSTSFTKGSEVENAETSAWGRAIAALGFEVKRGIASREEMRRQQPERGERTQRREAQPPSSAVAPAPVRTPEEQALMGQLLEIPGMTIAQMHLLADAVGVKKGEKATAEQFRQMIAIAQPEDGDPSANSGVGAASVARGGDGSSGHLPAPIQTPSSEGSAADAASEAATGSVDSSPGSPAPAQPTFDDIFEATGGEEVPPKSRTTEEAIADAKRKAKVTA